MDSDVPGIELRAIVDALRRRLWLLVACLLGAAAIAFAISELQTRTYTATTSLLFSNTQLSQQIAGLQAVTPSSTQQSLQDTDVGLAEVGDMATKTAKRLHHGLTWKSVMHAIDVTAQGDTNLVTISGRSSSPRLAAQIANTYSSIFVAEQESAGHAYYAAALSAVQKQLAQLTPAERSGAQGVVLADRTVALATLGALPSGNVQVAAYARIPTSPSSPKSCATRSPARCSACCSGSRSCSGLSAPTSACATPASSRRSSPCHCSVRCPRAVRSRADAAASRRRSRRARRKPSS